MSDDLVAFLRAQLDEDETADWWHEQDCAGMPWGPHEPHCCEPRMRQVREVEAKRAIVDRYDTWPAEFPDWDGGYSNGLEDAVKWLAAAYRDHPDYRQEWAP